VRRAFQVFPTQSATDLPNTFRDTEASRSIGALQKL
jgi:hypothetical protein